MEDEGVVNDAAVGDNSTESSGDSLNPAWTPMLEKLPESLHPLVTPTLREWDSNFNRKVQEVQSGFQPYKEVIGDTDVEALSQALNFYRMAESDPRKIYDTMGEYYGYNTPDQGQQAQGTGEADAFEIDGVTQDELANNPKFQELMQNQQALAQVIMGQQEQARQAQAEQQLDQEIASLKDSHGFESEEDLMMVLNIATAQNITLAKAADALKGHNERISVANTRPPAPSVMRAGGTVPADVTTDPKSLDAKGTRSLVETILRNQIG